MTDNALVTAALAFELGINNSKIQLFPAHDFKAKDGRPKEITRWKINRTIAANLISQIDQQQDKVLIDYEHQTLNASKNGQPAPASGWFKNIQWVEGLGMFATDVEWTEKAKNLIKNKEYRYISPVFSYNKKTGEILALHHVGLVNQAAIDGMQDVSELMAAKVEHIAPPTFSKQEESICALMGVSQDDYIATKFLPKIASSTGLSNDEVSICERMGIGTNDYMNTKNSS